MKEIKDHIDEVHRNPSANEDSSSESESSDESDSTTDSFSLEELGIKKLPDVSERIKQNLQDLHIYNDGHIDIDEDSDDNYLAKDDELLLVE